MSAIDSKFPRVNLRETTPLTELIEDWTGRDLSYLLDAKDHFKVPEAWGTPAERTELEKAINDRIDYRLHGLVEKTIDEYIWDERNSVAYALADLFVDTASADQALRPEKLASRFGGVFQKLVDSIRRADVMDDPALQHPRLGLIEGRLRPGDVWWKERNEINFGSIEWVGTLLTTDESSINGYAALARMTPRRGMPVLDALAAVRGRSDQFRGVSVLAMQHLLGTTDDMFAKLIDLGLDPSDSLIVGKGYSTHWGSQQALVRRGYRASTLMLSHGLPGDSEWVPSKAIDGLEGDVGDGRQLALTWASLGRPEAGFHTQLIIDSGANWMLMSPEEIWPERFRAQPDGRPPKPPPQLRRVAVEQTTNGIRKLQDHLPLDFPVVNVAQSPVKRYLEGPIIGWSVAEEIDRVVADLKAQGVEREKRVTLVGYGTVGRHTAAALLMLGYDVKVVDIDDDALERARDDAKAWSGLEGKLEIGGPIKEAVVGASYVVGCTGHGIFEQDASIWEALEDGVVLFSASSSTQEFVAGKGAPVKLVTVGKRFDDKPDEPVELGYELFQGKRIRIGHPLWEMHWHRKLLVGKKEVLLANSGYPINFTGEEDPIRPELIQLTRSLMLLAAMQAVDLPLDAKGIIPLEAAGQKRIASMFMQRLHAAGERLVPKFIMGLLDEGYRRALHELDAQSVG